MKFIYVEARNGTGNFWINLSQIVSITKVSVGSDLESSNGDTYYIKESPEFLLDEGR